MLGAIGQRCKTPKWVSRNTDEAHSADFGQGDLSSYKAFVIVAVHASDCILRLRNLVKDTDLRLRGKTSGSMP